jgi:hypothetical protein
VDTANQLYYFGIYDNKEAAKKGILDELERRYPDPQTHVSGPVRADESPALKGWSYRYYQQKYEGNEALVAYIIDKEMNLKRADYGQILVDMTIKKMASTAPPAPSTAVVGEAAAAHILTDRGEYVEAVRAAFNQAVKETDAKTETQLGSRATHVSYR